MLGDDVDEVLIPDSSSGSTKSAFPSVFTAVMKDTGHGQGSAWRVAADNDDDDDVEWES